MEISGSTFFFYLFVLSTRTTGAILTHKDGRVILLPPQPLDEPVHETEVIRSFCHRGGASTTNGKGESRAGGFSVQQRPPPRQLADPRRRRGGPPGALELWHDLLDREISLSASVSANIGRRSSIPRGMNGAPSSSQGGASWFRLWSNIASHNGVTRQVGNALHWASLGFALKMVYDFHVHWKAMGVAVDLKVDYVNYTPDSHVEGPVPPSWYSDWLCRSAAAKPSNVQCAVANVALAVVLQGLVWGTRRRGLSLEYVPPAMPLALLAMGLLRGALHILPTHPFFAGFPSTTTSSWTDRGMAALLYALPMLFMYAAAAPSFSHYQEEQRSELHTLSQRATQILALITIGGSAVALFFNVPSSQKPPLLDWQVGFPYGSVWMVSFCAAIRLLCYPAVVKDARYLWNASVGTFVPVVLAWTMATLCRHTPLLRTHSFLNALGSIWFEGLWGICQALVGTLLLVVLWNRGSSPPPSPPPLPQGRGAKVVEFRRRTTRNEKD